MYDKISANFQTSNLHKKSLSVMIFIIFSHKILTICFLILDFGFWI